MRSIAVLHVLSEVSYQQTVNSGNRGMETSTQLVITRLITEVVFLQTSSTWANRKKKATTSMYRTGNLNIQTFSFHFFRKLKLADLKVFRGVGSPLK